MTLCGWQGYKPPINKQTNNLFCLSGRVNKLKVYDILGTTLPPLSHLFVTISLSFTFFFRGFGWWKGVGVIIYCSILSLIFLLCIALFNVKIYVLCEGELGALVLFLVINTFLSIVTFLMTDALLSVLAVTLLMMNTLLCAVTFLVMNNIVHSFPNPNVLDLKMGRLTYDPEATPEKRKHEMAKYPPLTQLGFQLTGMMVITVKDNTADRHDGNYSEG